MNRRAVFLQKNHQLNAILIGIFEKFLQHEDMVLPHPLLKRVLSRVVFYGGTACYLWLLQFVEQRMTASQQFAENSPVAARAIAR
jgi:hypothetical protein